MIYTQDREAFRRAFFIAWEKHVKKLPLDVTESQLIQVILLHPEYQILFDKLNEHEHQEFTLEENPFLHLSLHLAIREQIRINRPWGIAKIAQELQSKLDDPHAVEHRMMECLGRILWTAQQNGEIPSEADYLEQLALIL